MISQGYIKDVLNDPCMYRVYLKHVKGLRSTHESPAFQKGKLFEYHLIGSTRGGEKPEFPKKKNGEKTKEELDIEALADWGEGRMQEAGIDLSTAIVQPEWIVSYEKDGKEYALIMHPDLVAKVNGVWTIIDVKYTETSPGDRFRGWGAPEIMDHTQACQYVLGGKLKYGNWLPFMYHVFGKYGKGWDKIVKVHVSDATMELHQSKIEHASEVEFPEDMPSIEDPNTCRNCPLYDQCDRAYVASREEEIFI